MSQNMIEDYLELKKVLKRLGFEQIYEDIKDKPPNDEFKFGIWLSSSKILIVRSMRQNSIMFKFLDSLPEDLIELSCNTRLSEINK